MQSGNTALRVVRDVFSGLRTFIWFMVMLNGAEVASAVAKDGKLIDIVDDYVFAANTCHAHTNVTDDALHKQQTRRPNLSNDRRRRMY